MRPLANKNKLLFSMFSLLQKIILISDTSKGDLGCFLFLQDTSKGDLIKG